MTTNIRFFLFYCFFLYTVFVGKFGPQASQSDVLGELRSMISLVVGSYFGMPTLLLPGLDTASPGTPTVLTRVRCLSLKPDMDREVRSHPNSRISAKVQSWELGLSRVLRPDDYQNHPELQHVSSLHYRLRHQSCQTVPPVLSMFINNIFCHRVVGKQIIIWHIFSSVMQQLRNPPLCSSTKI